MNNSLIIGKPSFDKRKIPVLIDSGIFINEKVRIKNNEYIISCITVNKPYVIVLNKSLDDKIEMMVNDIQNFYIFPERINIIFSEYKNNLITNNVYEIDNYSLVYDSMCASLVAQTLYRNLEKNQEITIEEKDITLNAIYKENGELLIKEINKTKKLIK